MLIVLDGTNLIRRQYHAGGSGSLARTAGRLSDDLGGEVVVAWDSRPPYWRHELWAEYKAHRESDPKAEAFVRAAAREAKSHGIVGYYADRMEADDVAATLVASADGGVAVVSSDKDWCQMIDSGARWFAPERGGFEERDSEWVWKRYGVPPSAWVDFAALAGDSSDGIPGVRGVGPIRAAKHLAQYGSAEAWARTVNEAMLKSVLLWKELLTLRTDADLRRIA